MYDQTEILIVEDNSITALDLKHSLEKENYKVTSIETNLNGVKKSIKTSFPNLAIVDIQLGHKKNGIEIGYYLNSIDIPTIYSTSYFDTDTIHKALETEPVCYLVKPINMKELISNITLGLYKTNFKVDSQIKKINPLYSFDSRLNKLLFRDTAIHLSKMELKFVKFLLNSKEEVVLFENLEHYLWKNNPIQNSALRTIVYRLRKKLPVELIQTIPSLGFGFVKAYE